MNAVRKRRLIFVGVVLVATGVAVAIAIFALQRNMTYLYTPTEVDAGKVPANAHFRLGGIVKEGSIRHGHDGMKVDFTVTDRFHSMPVVYSGVLPDLFRQGQSVITSGHMHDGTFVATKVLAKHDETYMPPQVAKAIKKAEAKGRARAEEHAHARAATETGRHAKSGSAG